MMSGQLSIFVQVEAVNIYPTLFDTQQLSVIRGGSYFVAKAIQAVVEHPTFGQHLQPLSSGASSGLFRLLSNQDPEDLAREIARWLGTNPAYRLFTFTVESCRAEGLRDAREILAAKVRFRQLRQVTQVPDQPDEGGQAVVDPCGIDGRRRSNPRRIEKIKGKDTPVSTSVGTRLAKGRELKAGFYFELLGKAEDLDLTVSERERLERLHKRLHEVSFSEDLESLARCDKFRSLNNKIAVIYLDGNRFGAIQRDLVTSPDLQIDFDRGIRSARAGLMVGLLDALIDENVDGKQGRARLRETSFLPASDRVERALRFETLLWGGDEMTLVAPAWLGFALIQLFYRLTADWKRNERLSRILTGKESLTHAGGVVFCHAKTPISRMRRLAQQLAEDVKGSGDGTGRRSNLFDYLVLESIDYPVEPTLKEFRRMRYGDIGSYRRPIAPSADWFDGACMACERLLMDDGIARGQVFRLARRIGAEPLQSLFGCDLGPRPPPWRRASDAPVPDSESPFECAERRLIELAESRRAGIEDDLRAVANALGVDSDDPRERAWLWLHLAELWDYLVPERDHADQRVRREAVQ